MGNGKRFETGRLLRSASAWCAVLLALGCQDVSSDVSVGDPFPNAGGGGSVVPGGGRGFTDSAGSGNDVRPVVKAEQTPPPVSGGTLLALSDARRVLASDPDRDRIWLIDYLHNQFEPPIQLEHGALPSRAVEDSAGHAYVVLRGTGDVLTVDLETATAGERRHVCTAPRGITLAPSADKLLVACGEGRLIELPFTGAALSETALPLDARDVVVQRGRIMVSRFRSSELVELDAARSVAKATRLPNVSGFFQSVLNPTPSTIAAAAFEPAVAWRTVLGPNGNSVVTVHQRATTDSIVLPPHPEEGSKPTDGVGGGTNTAGPTPTPPPGGGSPYGGDFSGCGGIVQSAITVVQDGVAVTSPQLGGVVLPVDVAVSNDGFIAIASAGSADDSRFSPSSGNALVVLTASQIDRSHNGDCLQVPSTKTFTQPLVAVAFEPAPSGRILALGREPLQLFVVNGFRDIGIPNVENIVQIPAPSVEDTGHEIFHRDSGGGLACASCHPEGTDDGRTWNFAPTGARRTQAIDVGLDGTAPFHWDGDLPSIDSLMTEVFVRRMGGVLESSERIGAVQDWVFSLTPRAPIRAADDLAAQRGSELFHSRAVGCSSCHSGDKFTNNASVDVGTDGIFQVPSLRGVGQRVPVMHNGCAQTLRDRFDPACGGSAHGNTSQLDEGQISDLIAYLESI